MSNSDVFRISEGGNALLSLPVLSCPITFHHSFVSLPLELMPAKESW